MCYKTTILCVSHQQLISSNVLLLYYNVDNTDKRRLGEGIVGRLFNRELKDNDAQVNVKDQLAVLSDHR